MEHHFHSAHRPAQRFRIENGLLEQHDIAGHAPEVVTGAGGKIVQHPHLVADSDQPLHQMGADKPGPARYQYMHACPFSPGLPAHPAGLQGRPVTAG